MRAVGKAPKAILIAAAHELGVILDPMIRDKQPLGSDDQYSPCQIAG
ncbi:MAG: hypothetical protein KKB37_00435 [Alphaproteobacteria bacterium]|nr:hypothetical protein [Alphaproteobacteria bacterium]